MNKVKSLSDGGEGGSGSGGGKTGLVQLQSSGRAAVCSLSSASSVWPLPALQSLTVSPCLHVEDTENLQPIKNIKPFPSSNFPEYGKKAGIGGRH